MPSHLRFKDDDVDNYEPSESEDEYTEKEKQLLNKLSSRKKQDSDSEDEVYGVGPDEDGDDEEDDDKSDLALSDVEGQDGDDDLPDVRAWGKDKRKYYSTDYVDPDYGGFQGKDAQLAEFEEEEARNLQKQLAQQLDDDDFSLDIFVKKTEDDKKQTEEIIKTDVSKLTKRQKLQLLQKESPEFFGLVEDFEVKMLVARDYLHPVLEQHKKGQIPKCKAVDFVQTQYSLILNYATNIYMYLLLKASKVNIENHPIVKRLYQYRQLLSQLDPVYEEVIKPQIELMLEKDNGEEQEKKDEKSEKKKTLKLLANLANNTGQSKIKKKRAPIANIEQPIKKMKLVENSSSIDSEDVNKTNINLVNADTDSSNEDEKDDEQEVDTNETNDVDKRAITYEMAKNKGLTPYRKKEHRNPRVKHKLKYRKALIRRKGAVREPRKELTRYSGEISGIKASVTKSIKIKS